MCCQFGVSSASDYIDPWSFIYKGQGPNSKASNAAMSMLMNLDWQPGPRLWLLGCTGLIVSGCQQLCGFPVTQVQAARQNPDQKWSSNVNKMFNPGKYEPRKLVDNQATLSFQGQPDATPKE